jgi:hypothetical protein
VGNVGRVVMGRWRRGSGRNGVLKKRGERMAEWERRGDGSTLQDKYGYKSGLVCGDILVSLSRHRLELLFGDTHSNLFPVSFFDIQPPCIRIEGRAT